MKRRRHQKGKLSKRLPVNRKVRTINISTKISVSADDHFVLQMHSNWLLMVSSKVVLEL